MRPIPSLCSITAIALLAACGTTATTIATRQRLDRDFAGKLAYERVEATSSVRQFTQSDLDQLKAAVRERVPQSADGGVPVTVHLAVSDFGAGGSKMIVRVRVADAAGKPYAQFDIYETANTLMGALDQRSSVINAVADGVARSLMAISAAPPATLDPRNFGS